MTGAPAIETQALSKLFGPGLGLRPLNLRVQPGEVYGFIGPNGAGKTTTIRTLLGFLRPSGGAARILGLDTWRERDAVHARVGYLPGEVRLPAGLTAGELLARTAELRRGNTAYGREVAGRLGLDLRRRLGTLSKGNRQKAGLTLALMHRPELLILDEPTDGLDPLVQAEVMALLREAAAEGRTVFLSSHLLAEVEGIAGRVGIIRGGELVREESVMALKASLPGRLRLRLGGPVPEALLRLPGLSVTAQDETALQGTWQGPPGPLLHALAGSDVQEFSLAPGSLEDAFLGEYRRERA